MNKKEGGPSKRPADSEEINHAATQFECTREGRKFSRPLGRAELIRAARHEAAHAAVLMAIPGCRFESVRVSCSADGLISGDISNPSGPSGALLVASGAGAVADVGGHPGEVDVTAVVHHLATAPCCSSDLAAGVELAAELRADRSIAREVVAEAARLLTVHYPRYMSLAMALMRAPAAYPVEGGWSRELRYLRPDVYVGIPGCPVGWDGVTDIWAHPALTPAVAA